MGVPPAVAPPSSAVSRRDEDDHDRTTDASIEWGAAAAAAPPPSTAIEGIMASRARSCTTRTGSPVALTGECSAGGGVWRAATRKSSSESVDGGIRLYSA